MLIVTVSHRFAFRDHIKQVVLYCLSHMFRDRIKRAGIIPNMSVHIIDLRSNILCFTTLYSVLSVYSHLCCAELSTCPFYCRIRVTQKTNFHFMHLLRIIKFFYSCLYGIHCKGEEPAQTRTNKTNKPIMMMMM